jgi:hypothetical protein
VLAAFARTGQRPARSELERLARRPDVSLDAVLAELAETDVMAFDEPSQRWPPHLSQIHPGEYRQSSTQTARSRSAAGVPVRLRLGPPSQVADLRK